MENISGFFIALMCILGIIIIGIIGVMISIHIADKRLAKMHGNYKQNKQTKE